MYIAKPLAYSYNALEPFISERTIDIHYNKHYKKYLDKLNALLQKNNYNYRYTKEELVEHIDIFPLPDRGEILYDLGGVLNHELYFENIGPRNHELVGDLKEKVLHQYGSFENFKNEFVKQANNVVGSGYTFLVLDKENNLDIIATPNQETPYSYGLLPIMNIDLWEHAYYLDYQNNKNEYIHNFFSIVDFNKISRNYEKKKTL